MKKKKSTQKIAKSLVTEDGLRKKNLFTPIIPKTLHGKIIISALLILFTIVTSYKLTYASLWFDEGVEYLVSIMPFSKMIPAIRSTYQPPLYNFIMHFLLKISVSEYFFRFTGVIFGLFGCIGLYCAINEACNWKAAGITVFFYTFLRNIIYYNQECAEYTLVVANLFWTIYFFICLTKGYSRNKAIGFSGFCILSIYSQYGALFPLAGMTIAMTLIYALDKQWANFKRLAAYMGGAIFLFGTPLYFGFMKFQREIQGVRSAKPFENLFEELRNFVSGIETNFLFFFPTYYAKKLFTLSVEFLYLTTFGFLIWAVIQKKNRRYKYIAISGVLSYFLYCGAVRLGVYGYGSYGGRYVLPIMPIILVSIFVVTYYIFSSIRELIIAVNPKFSYICVIILAIPLTLNNFNNWKTIEKNWGKEDVRSALTMWLEKTDGKDELYLYYAAVPVFTFYAENRNLDYGKEVIDMWGIFGSGIDPAVTQYKNFHYGENMRGKDVEYVKNSISQSFSNNMPDSFWFILSHIHTDNQIYMDALSEMGYGHQVYRWPDARLLWLSLPKYTFASPIYFDTLNKSYEIYNIKGLSGQEETGVWTLGNEAEFQFNLPDSSNDLNLSFGAHPLIGESLSAQAVEIVANGNSLETMTISEAGTYNLTIPNSVITDNGLNLKFLLHTAVSPKELQINDDERILGLFFNEMSISEISS